MLKQIRKHWAARVATWLTIVTTGGIPLIPQPLPALPRPRHIQINELKDGLTDRPDAALRKKIEAKRAAKPQPDVRPLTGKEMRRLEGRGQYRNRAFMGAPMPWQRSLRDVNLCTGNLYKNFTDIQVKPARGAGLVLNRSYSSNDERVGPFGVGWTHAYEIRNEEMGDDNVDKSDFFGGKHGYHRDADGLYTPPVYAHDTMVADGTAPGEDGSDIVVSDTDTSTDGTVKHYIKNGNERDCDYIQDRHGNRTTLTYGQPAAMPDGSSRNLLTMVTDPSGRQLHFIWSNLGTQTQPAWRITEVQGPMYRVTYDYGADLNLWRVHLDPDGVNRTTAYTYATVEGESGLLATITDPAGATVTYHYAFPWPSHAPSGTVWVVREEEPGGVDASGAYRYARWWFTTCNYPGYPSYSICGWMDGQGSLSVRINIDANLRVTYESNNDYGVDWFMDYDSNNNVIRKNQIECGPDSGGGPMFDGNRTDRYVYGPYGNVLTHTQDGFGGTDTTTYYGVDQYFQRASQTDMNGHTTSYGVGTSSGPIGERGEVLWVRDARYAHTGAQCSYSYNEQGQKIAETNMNGVVAQFTYGDQYGNLTRVVQDAGSGHLNRTTVMTCDVVGNVLTATDPSGRTMSTTYNSAGQPEAVSVPATANSPAENISYAYNDAGQTVSVSDNRGTTVLAYEPNGARLHSVTDPVTGTTTYTYGPHGELRTVGLPGGGTLNYAYWERVGETRSLNPTEDGDKWGLMLKSITDDQGREVDYDLDFHGHVCAARYDQAFNSSGSLIGYCETTYAADQSPTTIVDTHAWLRQVSTVYHWQTNGQWRSRLLSQNNYTYDATGQRLSNIITRAVLNTDGSPVFNSDGSAATTTRTETYGYDELNRLTSVNYGDGETQGYTFDAMGNRLTKADNVTGNESYTYNAANMLLSRNGQAYTNDANGNTLTGGGRTMTWDAQNRMVACTLNGTTSTFTYGADGLRRSSTVGGVTTNYALDGQNVVREFRGGTATATYLTGPTGPMYRRDDLTGQVRWYVYDGLGSVVGEVDPNGNMTATRQHDVYGLVRQSTGTRTSAQGFCGSLGHVSEEDTGLIYMRARYMDPVTGRFVSEDPAGDGGNWYAYCAGNPVNFVDATGREFTLVGSMQSMFIGAITGAASAAVSNWVLTGTVKWSDVCLGACIGGCTGGLATTGKWGSVVGSYVLGCSGREFADLCAHAVGSFSTGAGVGSVLYGLQTHNAHIQAVMDTIYDDAGDPYGDDVSGPFD